MLFRILTEDINRETVEEIVRAHVKGFSLYPITGYWEDSKENSLVIEIDGGENLASVVREIAQTIKAVNSQDAVLVQRFAVDSILV